jgi:hypothetical protein
LYNSLHEDNNKTKKANNRKMGRSRSPRLRGWRPLAGANDPEQKASCGSQSLPGQIPVGVMALKIYG